MKTEHALAVASAQAPPWCAAVHGVALVAMTFACPASVRAQEDLVGHYSGYYRKFGLMDASALGLTLAITSAENGVIRAEAHRMTRRYICAGAYEMEGSYENDHLRLVSVRAPGGHVGCRMSLRLQIEGDTLRGRLNAAMDVVLSKRSSALSGKIKE